MKTIFVILDYDGTPTDVARKRNMRKSWTPLVEQGVEFVRPKSFKRSSKDIGDPREMWFVKDIIAAGLKKAKSPDDIVAWVNDDVWIHPQLPEQLRFHCARFAACTAQRVDYDTYERHPGRDLFAATKRWWDKYWDEVPDGILGAPDFDLHFASLILLMNVIRTTPNNMIETHPPAELPRGFLRHQDHTPAWTTPALKHSPASMHNRRLFSTWAKINLPELKFNDHLETITFDT
jgi:hypothetical protein